MKLIVVLLFKSKYWTWTSFLKRQLTFILPEEWKSILHLFSELSLNIITFILIQHRMPKKEFSKNRREERSFFMIFFCFRCLPALTWNYCPRSVIRGLRERNTSYSDTHTERLYKVLEYTQSTPLVLRRNEIFLKLPGLLLHF